MNLFPRGYLPTLPLLAAIFGLGLNVRAADTTPANEPTILPELVVTPSVQADFSLGTSTYNLSPDQIDTMAQGSNSTFNQLLIHAPGVGQDSAGQVHFREEDPYYQYYINGILLPRGIEEFGQDIDTRFVDS